MDLFNLDNHVAIVTGAGRGIGREIALGLARAGCDVVICSRTESELNEVAEEIHAIGSTALVVACDVSKPEDINHVISEALARFKKIDILINNAGLTRKHPAEDFPLEDWHKIIQINLTGVFLFTQKVGKVMLEQGKGSIVNISSIASKQALTDSIAYAASKGRREYANENICNGMG